MSKYLTLIILIFFSAPISASELSGTLKDINNSGKIRIGFRSSLPPMSFLNNKGVAEGYSIDLCKLIAAAVERDLSKEIEEEYIAVNAENRFKALSEKKIDILCGATTETLSRREYVDFTQHIFITGGSYMVRKGTKLKNNFSGKKIGVVKNTTTAAALAELFKEADVDAEIVKFDTTADGFNNLTDGKIDAFSADQVVLIGLIMAAQNLVGDLTILPDFFSHEPIALAVRRNDADFRLIADRVLSDLYRRGEIDDIYNRWFGNITGDRPPALQALFQLNSLPEQ